MTASPSTGARASRAARPTLVFGDRRWALADGASILGRGEDADVRVESTGVSRHHARINISGGGATVADLGSKNGTFAGPAQALDRVTAPRPLHDGDIIRLGRTVRLVFRAHDDDDMTESEASRTATLDRLSRVQGNPPMPARKGAVGTSEFRREGELWTLRFAGQVVRLADAKGLHDLARLLARPGVDVHCLELADRPLEPAGADPVLDARARREIQSRARELQREIEAADQAHDLGRAEQAREELDRLTDQLAGALGLHGRSRNLGDAAERARSSVTWRIRSAIKRIAAVHPRLARHLQNAVRTGTFCGYHPETPVDWRL